jgi:hypothetical protein
MQASEFLSALMASQGNVDLTRENELFGQFVGDWEFDWYGFEKNMEAQHEKGEWIFSWILEGRAIQDVWIIPDRNRRNCEKLAKGEWGTTIRFFNTALSVWNVVWIGPVKGRFNTFMARKVEDEIVLEETNNPEFKMKWIFSEITSTSFNWRSIVSRDEGNTWDLVQKMIVKRKEVNA